MPGQKVCVVEDEWPDLPKTALLGISLWTPTWYNIFDFQIKDFTADFEGIVTKIFDMLWEKGTAVVNSMFSFGDAQEDGPDEESWDQFSDSETWQTLRGGLDTCRRQLDSNGKL